VTARGEGRALDPDVIHGIERVAGEHHDPETRTWTRAVFASAGLAAGTGGVSAPPAESAPESDSQNPEG
jgi:hypothetical protein